MVDSDRRCASTRRDALARHVGIRGRERATDRQGADQVRVGLPRDDRHARLWSGRARRVGGPVLHRAKHRQPRRGLGSARRRRHRRRKRRVEHRATAGPSQFVWEARRSGLNTIKLSKSWQRLVDVVPANAALDVGLAFTFPTASNSALVHSTVATLRATASGAPATSSESRDDNPEHHVRQHQARNAHRRRRTAPSTSPSIRAPRDAPRPSHFVTLTAPEIVKTSVEGQNVAYHSEGLPPGTYQWKCYMEDCCYGTLVVQ